MALQGTLDTFALPDVLRLLAATKKSGQLLIDSGRGAGRVCVDDGMVTAAVAAHAPHAVEPVDALFELLRFEDGSFTFDADAAPDGPGRDDVEELLEGAEQLLAEWREIEAVVPSLTSFVAMRSELPGDITFDQHRWTTLVAVGSGATVGSIGEALGLTELAVSRAVRELVELGAVDVEARLPDAAAPAPVAETVDEEVDGVPDAESAPPVEAVPVLEAAPTPPAGDAPSLIPGPKARRARPRRLQAAEAPSDVFVPLDLSALSQPGSYDEGDEHRDAAAPSSELTAAFPGLAARRLPDKRADDEPSVDDETERQLANPSPRAADAVRAAASARTDEERDAALAEAVETEDEPLNRGLLLRFLSSTKS